MNNIAWYDGSTHIQQLHDVKTRRHQQTHINMYTYTQEQNKIGDLVMNFFYYNIINYIVFTRVSLAYTSVPCGNHYIDCIINL